MEQVDLLAIAAHPDDVELTSAGTMMKMIDAGYSVGILDLTEGEMGTRGTPGQRASEAEAARKIIGAVFRANLNLGDSRLRASIENRMKVAQAIRDARPRTVILPYWGVFGMVWLTDFEDWAIVVVASMSGLLILPEVFYGRKILRWR